MKSRVNQINNVWHYFVDLLFKTGTVNEYKAMSFVEILKFSFPIAIYVHFVQLPEFKVDAAFSPTTHPLAALFDQRHLKYISTILLGNVSGADGTQKCCIFQPRRELLFPR